MKGKCKNNIISRYKSVFDKELGTLKNVEVSLKIKADAIPKFCRARPIPYALKDRVEKELERLVTEGILKPISHSEWAAPIVPVIKPDNNVRICGDYKQTINRASNCDKYLEHRIVINTQCLEWKTYLHHWVGVKVYQT